MAKDTVPVSDIGLPNSPEVSRRGVWKPLGAGLVAAAGAIPVATASSIKIHPNAKNVSFNWEGTGPGDPWQMALMIETDLQLNPHHPDFDFNAVKDIIAATQAYIQQYNSQIERFRIVSVAKGQL